MLDLGKQPLANAFGIKVMDLPRYPLQLVYCRLCGHLQLSVAVDPTTLFANYIYRSGTTKTLKDYFDDFAGAITSRHGVGRVLDVACNDGSQLDKFKMRGWKTQGVDPAANLCELHDHPVKVGFFNESCLDLGRFDVIIAQNVVAHTMTPDVIFSVAHQMTDHFYVQTSQANMIDGNQFDTIYHEHISFFSPNSMIQLALRNDWHLQSVGLTPIHGDSYVFHFAKNSTQVSAEKLSQARVEAFASNVRRVIADLRAAMESTHNLIGYGAAAKAMTLLNSVGVSPQYVIDDAKEKQGLFCPGIGSPIVHPEMLLYEPSPLKLMPLAWNFESEIITRVRKYFIGNIDILRYFPEVSWRHL
jgi:hypothetical protein